MGLFCEINDIEPSPLSIILAKQHHLKSEKFETIKVNSVIQVEIIGIKFNYNDTQISCIGRLAEDGNSLEETYEDEEEVSEEEMDGEDDDEEEEEKISFKFYGGGVKNDIISAVGGTLNQDAEDEVENIELNMEEIEMDGDTGESVEIDDELGLDFEGEVLDLDAVARQDVEPMFLHENNEIPNKLTEDVFQKEVRVNTDYTPFIKKPSNKINYHIYLILSDLFINYEKYGVKPKMLSLSKRNKYYKSIKNYMKINASIMN